MTTVRRLAFELGFADKEGPGDYTYSLRGWSGTVPNGCIPTRFGPDYELPHDMEMALRNAAAGLEVATEKEPGYAITGGVPQVVKALKELADNAFDLGRVAHTAHRQYDRDAAREQRTGMLDAYELINAALIGKRGAASFRRGQEERLTKWFKKEHAK